MVTLSVCRTGRVGETAGGEGGGLLVKEEQYVHLGFDRYYNLGR